MTTSNHVPGPWHVGGSHPQNACVYVQDGDGHDIAVLYGGHDEGAKQNADGNWAEQPIRDATARLIAAAPEMLEALKEAQQWIESVVDALEPQDDDQDRFERIAAAIAKAEGR